MSAKVVTLADDARFNPQLCSARLAEDFAAGKVTAQRMIVVIEERNATTIRASGPGMDNVAMVVGLLQIAATQLMLNNIE